MGGDELAGSKGRMRASRADRERVIDALKIAFVRERLTRDELDGRVGDALVARTYAELDAVTVGIPAEPHPVPPLPPMQPYRPVRAAIKGSAVAIAATGFTASIFAGVMGHDPKAALVVVLAFAICTVIAGLLASMIAGVVTIISRCL